MNMKLIQRFSHFDHVVVGGAKWSGLNISKSADLMGFARSTVIRVYTE